MGITPLEVFVRVEPFTEGVYLVIIERFDILKMFGVGMLFLKESECCQDGSQFSAVVTDFHVTPLSLPGECRRGKSLRRFPRNR